jgi:hypothetical protein
MKALKTGHRFDPSDYKEGDYTSKEMLEFLNANYSSGKQIIEFDNNGNIIGVSTTKGTKASGQKDLLRGVNEALYCVSYKDAIVGLNYSELIQKKSHKYPSISRNPFSAHHPVKSGYETKTDSVGLKAEDFKLFGKLKKSKK